MNNEEIAETIYNTLTKQSFYDWYCEDGDFEKYIAGDEDAKSKEQILEDVKTLFKLK